MSSDSIAQTQSERSRGSAEVLCAVEQREGRAKKDWRQSVDAGEIKEKGEFGKEMLLSGNEERGNTCM